jgi:hypothetical protein
VVNPTALRDPVVVVCVSVGFYEVSALVGRTLRGVGRELQPGVPGARGVLQRLEGKTVQSFLYKSQPDPVRIMAFRV